MEMLISTITLYCLSFYTIINVANGILVWIGIILSHFFDPEAVILTWTGNLYHQHILLLNSHTVFSDMPRQWYNFSFKRVKCY